MGCLHPLLETKVDLMPIQKNPCDYKGNTHTHTHGRLAARNLNSQLKSLGEERKTERAKRKGQERKIGSEMNEGTERRKVGLTEMLNNVDTLALY